jgi:hypothetical protein
MELSFPLIFNRAQLEKVDMSIIDFPNWFNDNLIAFYFEYLKFVVLPDPNAVEFVPCTTCHLINHGG